MWVAVWDAVCVAIWAGVRIAVWVGVWLQNSERTKTGKRQTISLHVMCPQSRDLGHRAGKTSAKKMSS